MTNVAWHPAPFVLQMGIKGERSIRLRLFSDTGQGIRHNDSCTQWIDPGAEFTKVQFRIDARRFKELRLAQVDSAIPLELRSITLHRFLGDKIKVNLNQLKPIDGIATIAQVGAVIAIVPTAKAGDGATIAIQFPQELVESPLMTRVRAGAVALLGLAAIAFLWCDRAEIRPRSVAKTGPSSRRIKVKIVITSFLTLTYLLTSVFEWNSSSSGIWRYLADWQSPHHSLIVGSPKEIRSDEWGTQTPWILSQAKHAPPFPLTNANLGDDAAPLLTNLPARHWSMLFRPQMLGFFFLNFERAFAFYWNFKWFGLLLACFLFFEAISSGKNVVALASALFLLFSPYIQWWFSTPTSMPEIVAMLFFALWSVHVILHTRVLWRMIAASLLLSIALGQFVFCCYPRFQIPLFYLGLVVIGSIVIDRPRENFLPIRIGLLSAALLLTGVTVWLWLGDVAGLIHRVSTFAYPGKVVSVGGSYPWWGLLSPFLEFSMNDGHWPSGFMNVCEAAGFLFLTPLLFAVAIRDLVGRRFDAILLGVTGFILLALAFMLWGIPLWLAQWTGWSYVYSTRVQLAIGAGTTIGLVRYLSRPDSNSRRPFAIELLLMGAVAFALWAAFRVVNKDLGEFVNRTNIIAAALFFSLVFVCLWTRKAGPALALLVLPTLFANGLVNPVQQGLPGFEQSKLAQWVSEHQRLDPAAKWIVIGRSARRQFMAEFIKTTGARVLGGVRCTPDPEMVRALDPESKYSDVYKRFAWMSFVPSADSMPVFKLTGMNSYDVQLPLRTDIFDQLGVRYVLAVDLPLEDATIQGFELIGERFNCRLLQREKR